MEPHSLPAQSNSLRTGPLLVRGCSACGPVLRRQGTEVGWRREVSRGDLRGDLWIGVGGEGGCAGYTKGECVGMGGSGFKARSRDRWS